jgi:transposase-like protein
MMTKDKKWIQKATEKKGTFTAKAKRKGITSAQLQANVEKNPDDYDEKTKKQAQLRETLVKLNNNKKSKK